LVRDRVWKYIVGMNNNNLAGLTTAQLQAKIHNSVPDAEGNIRVWIDQYPYKPVTPLAPLLGLSTINLNRSAIFRYERSS
jgi:hypothetical protein